MMMIMMIIIIVGILFISQSWRNHLIGMFTAVQFQFWIERLNPQLNQRAGSHKCSFNCWANVDPTVESSGRLVQAPR